MVVLGGVKGADNGLNERMKERKRNGKSGQLTLANRFIPKRKF